MLLQTDVLLLEALQPHLQDINTFTSQLTGDWHGSHPGLTCSCVFLGGIHFLIHDWISKIGDVITACQKHLTVYTNRMFLLSEPDWPALSLAARQDCKEILSSSGCQVDDGCQFRGPGSYSCQSLSREDVLQRIDPFSLSYLHGEGNESSLCWPSQQSVIPDDRVVAHTADLTYTHIITIPCHGGNHRRSHRGNRHQLTSTILLMDGQQKPWTTSPSSSTSPAPL